MTDWKALEDAEDHAYFMAELVDISPESFTLEEKKHILHDMIESSTAIENAMRDEFAELDEVAQTRLIDDLAADGPGRLIAEKDRAEKDPRPRAGAAAPGRPPARARTPASRTRTPSRRPRPT